MCYAVLAMTKATVAIPTETVKKFAELTSLLAQVGKLARDINLDVADPKKAAPLAAFLLKAEDMSADFWEMSDELQEAFVDMSPGEIDDLIDEAVTSVRKQRKA